MTAAVGVYEVGMFGPGRPGAVKRPQRFPMKIHFVWGFLYGRAGRLTAETGGFRPGQSRRSPRAVRLFFLSVFFVEYMRTLFFCLKNYSEQITDYKTITQQTQINIVGIWDPDGQDGLTCMWDTAVSWPIATWPSTPGAGSPWFVCACPA
jgi:hypothetical protein